jgi:hypothetical protein
VKENTKDKTPTKIDGNRSPFGSRLEFVATIELTLI